MADTVARPRAPTGLTLTQLAWMVPVTAILIALRRPTQDNSYLWHIEAGLRQLDLGSVLTADPFTFTASGQPWRTQSWLVELFYGWSERIQPLISAPVIVGVCSVLLITAVGLNVARRRGILGPVATVWVMWLTLGYFTARPVFPSLVLVALVVLAANRPQLRWTMPLLFWLWASVHGSFFMGLGYLVLMAIKEKEPRRLWDAGVGAVAATLTAHGWGAWETLFNFASSSDNLDLISEWQPPDLLSIALLPFLIAILGLVWLGARHRLDTTQLWIVLPFLAFAFTANRAIPIAAIMLAASVFPATDSKVGQSPFRPVLAGSVVLLIILLPLVLPIEEDIFETRFPVEATEHLEPVKTFHDDSAGGYLIYQNFPQVFVDDRAELFGELYAEFIDARAARPGWDELFARYDLTQALLRREDPVGTVLTLSGWSTVHTDDEFLVLRAPGA